MSAVTGCSSTSTPAKTTRKPSAGWRPFIRRESRMGERDTRLSHVDARGKARMVDVGMKPPTRRRGNAAGRVYLGLRPSDK